MKKNYLILLFFFIAGMLIFMPCNVFAEEKVSYPSNCNYYNSDKTFKLYCSLSVPTDGKPKINCGYEYNLNSVTKLQQKSALPANWTKDGLYDNLMFFIGNTDDYMETSLYKSLSKAELGADYYFKNSTCPKYAIMWIKDQGSVTQDSDYSFIFTNDDKLNDWKTYVKNTINIQKQTMKINFTEFDLTYESNVEHSTDCKTSIEDYTKKINEESDPTNSINEGDKTLCYCSSTIPKTDEIIKKYLSARTNAITNKSLSIGEFTSVCPRFDNSNLINEEENPENEDIVIDWSTVDYDTCESLLGDPNNIETFAGLINRFFDYFKIIAPIIVLLLSSVEFIKAIIQNDDDTMKKAQKRLMTRIIIAIALFLVPTLVMILLKLFNIVSDASCIK